MARIKKVVKIPRVKKHNKTPEVSRVRMRDEMVKKAKEMSVLCNVEVAIVMYGERKDENPFVWPGEPVTRERMVRYMTMQEFEKEKKATTSEHFLKERIRLTEDEADKMGKKNNEKELEWLMFELLEGIKTVDQLDHDQLQGLSLLMDDKILKIEARQKQLEKEGHINSENVQNLN